MQETSNNSLQIFHKFITKVQATNYLQTIQGADQKFAIRQFKISQISPLMARQIYHNIFMKFNKNSMLKGQLNWWQNELRIFVWILVNYLTLKNKIIQELGEDDWQFFSKLFPHKKLILFQYQSINILKEHGQASKWSAKQDQLFSRLVHQKGLKCKWSELAKLLYIQSQKLYFRTPKQCRQRWLNHLDPTKCKTQWEPREDFALISYVQSKGKKWAEIAKILKNKRNQHSIKNRFKSLITKQEKYHKQKLQESELIHYIFKRYENHVNCTNNHGIVKKQQCQQMGLYPSVQQRFSDCQTYNNHIFNSYLPQKNFNQKVQRSFMPYLNNKLSLISSQQNTKQGICSKHFKFCQNQQIKSQKQFTDSRITQQSQRLSISAQNLYQLSHRNNNQLPSLVRGASSDNYFFSQNQNQERERSNEEIVRNQLIQEQNQMSQKERQIRVDIFLAEDPFDMLKPFFLKKKIQNQN